MTTIKLSEFCVRDNTGNVNVTDTLSKFEGVLNQYQTSVQAEQNTIRSAIHAVFDNNRGTTLTMKVFKQLALQQMNAQPENYMVLNDKVRSFVRNSSEFHVGRGAGGGVSRVADQSK